jgi:hypothetical protein
MSYQDQSNHRPCPFIQELCARFRLIIGEWLSLTGRVPTCSAGLLNHASGLDSSFRANHFVRRDEVGKRNKMALPKLVQLR